MVEAIQRRKVASGTSYGDIAQDLGISADLVEWRTRTMRKTYRRRMVKLRMWPGMDLLKCVSSPPGAVAKLRKVA